MRKLPRAPLHPPPPPPSRRLGRRFPHLLWFASSVLVATALIGLWRTGGIATRIAISLLNPLITPANVLLAVSFLVQGVGFNLAFFAHADWETLALASVTLRPVLVGVLGYLVVTLACPMLLGRGTCSRRWELGMVAAGLVGMGLNAPAWSFACTLAGWSRTFNRRCGCRSPWLSCRCLRPRPMRGAWC